MTIRPRRVARAQSGSALRKPVKMLLGPVVTRNIPRAASRRRGGCFPTAARFIIQTYSDVRKVSRR
jgi:hypothetical protein